MVTAMRHTSPSSVDLDPDGRVRLAALRETCAFLSLSGVVRPAKRREAERVIAALFERGLDDVNRLAIKAIVQVA